MRLILTLTACFAVMQSISAAGVNFADVGDAREELHHANIAPRRVPSIMTLMKKAAIAGLLAIGMIKLENEPATRRAAVRAVNTGLSMSAKALQSMAAGVRDYNQDETFDDYYYNLLGKVSGNDEFNVLSEYESWKFKSELNKDDFISETYRNDFLRLIDQLTEDFKDWSQMIEQIFGEFSLITEEEKILITDIEEFKKSGLRALKEGLRELKEGLRDYIINRSSEIRVSIERRLSRQINQFSHEKSNAHLVRRMEIVKIRALEKFDDFVKTLLGQWNFFRSIMQINLKLFFSSVNLR